MLCKTVKKHMDWRENITPSHYLTGPLQVV